jgi:two-component system, OmpR family, sensor histidine kinase KdpD
VHAALLEQAIFNVLDNAIKFSPEGAPIVIRCALEQASILVSITDMGPGIPEEEQERVFERFHTAEKGDRRKSGSGLGLTICRGMIAAHGGTVTIHNNQISDLVRGCCVKILLPIALNSETTPSH